MGALLAVGFVKFDTGGKRVYYSINYDTTENLLSIANSWEWMRVGLVAVKAG